MTGTWNFTANSQTFNLTYVGTATLQQNGNAVSGQTTLSGSPCATSASISGTVSGNNLTMQLNENGELVNFNGTIDSGFASASGSFNAAMPFGCTDGDVGTWTATKQLVIP